MRGAYQAIDKGQMEAAVGVGLTPMQGFYRIVLPHGGGGSSCIGECHDQHVKRRSVSLLHRCGGHHRADRILDFHESWRLCNGDLFGVGFHLLAFIAGHPESIWKPDTQTAERGMG